MYNKSNRPYEHIPREDGSLHLGPALDILGPKAIIKNEAFFILIY